MGLKEDNVFYITGPYLLTSKLIIEYYASLCTYMLLHYTYIWKYCPVITSVMNYTHNLTHIPTQ